jgi:thioredoxin-dependent peroxiredoxin
MKNLLRAAAFAVAAIFTFNVAAQEAPLAGTAAPAFTLQDQKGEWQSLAKYQGQWVVLYFYPKDFTPGCTTEVCTFRDDVAKLHKAGAEVLGVSLDDVKSHAEFADKYHVPFPLLSDGSQVTAKAYGVLGTAKTGMSYAKRETFLIDPKGKVAKRYENVDPKENSAQVLADLDALKKAG